MGVDVSFADLDVAVSRLESGLEVDPNAWDITWASERCIYSRFVHKNIWEIYPEKKRVKAILKLLTETRAAVISMCFRSTDEEEREKLIIYARNIGLRIINLQDNYLRDKPTDFAPDDELKEEEERVRRQVAEGRMSA